MMSMAERTIESNQEWQKSRREALKAVGGVYASERDEGKGKEQRNGTGEASDGEDADAMSISPPSKRTKDKGEARPLARSHSIR